MHTRKHLDLITPENRATAQREDVEKLKYKQSDTVAQNVKSPRMLSHGQRRRSESNVKLIGQIIVVSKG